MKLRDGVNLLVVSQSNWKIITIDRLIIKSIKVKKNCKNEKSKNNDTAQNYRLFGNY